jgi:hypothetical protein
MGVIIAMADNFSLKYYHQIESRKIDWLWYPYIPYGKITIVQGDPGDGKTTFILSLIAKMSKCDKLPLSDVIISGNSIYQNTEDNLADTIKPRLESQGADCSKISFIEKSDSLSLDDDCFEDAITRTGAKLLVLDPIQAFVGDNIDMNRANVMRPRLNRLKEIAERTGCAIVLIGHLNKNSAGRAGYRGLGSIDISAAARSVLIIGKLKEYPDLRFMAQQKNNLAPIGDTLAYTLKDGKVDWIGVFDVTADEVSSGDYAESGGKLQIAQRLITNKLLQGRVALKDIMTLCEDNDISDRTLRRAKANMNIKSIKVKGSWYWLLDK